MRTWENFGKLLKLGKRGFVNKISDIPGAQLNVLELFTNEKILNFHMSNNTKSKDTYMMVKF